VDQEESYFDTDDDEPATVVPPPPVDQVAAQEVENELHRTPRMFSLAQAPLLNNGPLRMEENDSNELNGNPPEPKHDGEAKTNEGPTAEE
jgi:hypothetical protein